MPRPMTLSAYLTAAGTAGGPQGEAIRQTVHALAMAGARIAELLAQGDAAGRLAAARGPATHGDAPKELDLRADALVAASLADMPVASLASEEQEAPVRLNRGAPLAVAVDPLDGSSNIETNAPLGTIFSILPAADDPAAPFLQPGSAQLAAGFLIYGPQTALVLTLGDGTHRFTLDRATGEFVCHAPPAAVPLTTTEYAINAANLRHWDEPTRSYVNDCLLGAEGPRGIDFNTRWIASVVADAYRILVRGGVYLYPGDSRPSYRQGRLRLVYEANPIAWLIEEAGGAATDGRRRILGLVPRSIHQRVPLVFGAAEEVRRIADAHVGAASDAPLFGYRGLLRPAPMLARAPSCL